MFYILNNMERIQSIKWNDNHPVSKNGNVKNPFFEFSNFIKVENLLILVQHI